MYTVDYFIKKFEAIPEENWCTHFETNGAGQHCAVGHCDKQDEFNSLYLLTDFYPMQVNDGIDLRYQQNTPKQRILAALYDIKANEAVKEVQTIIEQKIEVAVCSG